MVKGFYGGPTMQHCKYHGWLSKLGGTQCSHNQKLGSCQRGKHLYNTCLGNESLYEELTHCSRQYRAWVREIFTQASDVSSEVCSHHPTASRSLGHPCLVSLLFIHPYIYLLVFFLFLRHAHAILGDNAHINKSMYILPQTVCRHSHVSITTKVHKCTKFHC